MSMSNPRGNPFDEVIDRSGTHTSKWGKYAGRDILPFWVADMDFAAPPFVLQAIEERLAHPILGYTRPPAELSEAFVAWLARQHNWQVAEEWLVWLPGVVTGFNMAARAVAQPGGAITGGTQDDGQRPARGHRVQGLQVLRDGLGEHQRHLRQ